MVEVHQLYLGHAVTKFIHVLLFVYWLGADAGVYYSSGFVIDPTRSRDARLMAFKIFVNLDMLPRYCMALMLTVGGILAEFVGYGHPAWQMAAIIALGPIWVAVVHLIHAREGTEFAKRLGAADYYFRLFMIVALVASVAYHWSTGELRPFPWLAAKLLVFAFLIFCGFMIRRNLPPFIEGFRALATSGPTPDADQKMISGLGACRPYVLAIWAGVALSAFLGIWKPGAL